MIAALDSHGELYLCLMQPNTNTATFSEYMRHLVRQLDQDRPKWRADTVLQLDGATWHKT